MRRRVRGYGVYSRALFEVILHIRNEMGWRYKTYRGVNRGVMHLVHIVHALWRTQSSTAFRKEKRTR